VKQSQISFTFRGRKVEFEREARQLHRTLRRSFYRWLVTDRPFNLFTFPVIYSMAIPMVILDAFITAYQAICFPIYGIAKVKRGDYIALDRHRLGYLNFIERFHCEYCAYANGLLAYSVEIAGRTEQYFCPIKHAHKMLGTHRFYSRFLEFGDAADFHKRQEEFRVALAERQMREPDGG
jgi:hypothetical protein